MLDIVETTESRPEGFDEPEEMQVKKKKAERRKIISEETGLPKEMVDIMEKYKPSLNLG